MYKTVSTRLDTKKNSLLSPCHDHRHQNQYSLYPINLASWHSHNLLVAHWLDWFDQNAALPSVICFLPSFPDLDKLCNYTNYLEGKCSDNCPLICPWPLFYMWEFLDFRSWCWYLLLQSVWMEHYLLTIYIEDLGQGQTVG